jgi:hypothetical protein
VIERDRDHLSGTRCDRPRVRTPRLFKVPRGRGEARRGEVNVGALKALARVQLREGGRKDGISTENQRDSVFVWQPHSAIKRIRGFPLDGMKRLEEDAIYEGAVHADGENEAFG